MEDWIDELAVELGEDPLTRDEIARLLDVARDVAHRVERKTTPLAAFVLGTAIGRAEGGGMDRARAMEGVFATLERLLPDVPAEPVLAAPEVPAEAVLAPEVPAEAATEVPAEPASSGAPDVPTDDGQGGSTLGG